MGWNITIRDSDGHKIIENNSYKDENGKIILGNHVWICSEVKILKNTFIGDNSVIGYNSCVVGLKSPCNSLCVGYPAKVIKNNINWEK